MRPGAGRAAHPDAENELNQPPDTADTSRSKDPDESEIVRKIACGDRSALSAFYDRTNAFAYGMALRVTEEQGEAEQVVLDAYTDAWRRASTFDPAQASARTWLASLVVARASDRIGGPPAESESPGYLRDLLEARIEREPAPAPTQSAVAGKPETRATAPYPAPRTSPITPPAKEPSRLPSLVIIALAIVGAIAVFAWRQADSAVRRLNEQLSVSQADVTNLRTLLEVQRERSRELEQINAAVSSNSTKLIHLVGPAETPSPSVVIFWNTEKSRVLIDGFLPAPPEGKVYQLWFMMPRENLSAGLIQTDPLGHVFKAMDVSQEPGKISGAGITLEPVGGSKQPTPPIFAFGRVQ